MLGGWYCRTMATEESFNESKSPQKVQIIGNDNMSSNRSPTDYLGTVDYKKRYKNMKKKLKFLIYENEYFQDLIRSNQRRLLKVSRDRAFLLDRLLVYEKPAKDSSDTDATASSNDLDSSVVPGERKVRYSKLTSVGEVPQGRKRKLVKTQSDFKIQPQSPQNMKSPSDIAILLQDRTRNIISPNFSPKSESIMLISQRDEKYIMDNESYVAAEECVPMECI